MKNFWKPLLIQTAVVFVVLTLLLLFVDSQPGTDVICLPWLSGFLAFLFLILRVYEEGEKVLQKSREQFYGYSKKNRR